MGEGQVANPVPWLWGLRTLRAPGWSVLQETAPTLHFGCSRNVVSGQSSSKAKQERRDLGAAVGTLHQGCTSLFRKFDEQSRQRPSMDSAAAH